MRSRNLQRRLEYRQCPFDQRGWFTVRFIGMRSQLKTNALRYLLHQFAFLSLVLRRTITAGWLEAHGVKVQSVTSNSKPCVTEHRMNSI